MGSEMKRQEEYLSGDDVAAEDEVAASREILARFGWSDEGLEGISSIALTASRQNIDIGGTALTLGTSALRMGRRVLLADIDSHRPRLHRTLRIPSQPGIADVLAEREELPKAIRSLGNPNIDVLPFGRRQSRRFLIDADRRFAELLLDLRDAYDFIIVTASSAQISTPTLPWISYVQSVVLVADHRTRRSHARQVRNRLFRCGIGISGAVFKDDGVL